MKRTVTQQDVERYKQAYRDEILRINREEFTHPIVGDELEEALRVPSDDEIRKDLEEYGGDPKSVGECAANIEMNYGH